MLSETNSSLSVNENIKELLEVFTQVINGNNNELRKQAEEKLQKLEINVIDFTVLASKLIILKDENLDISDSIRLTIIVYLKNLIIKTLDNNPNFKIQNYQQLIEILINLSINGSLINNAIQENINNILQLVVNKFDNALLQETSRNLHNFKGENDNEIKYFIKIIDYLKENINSNNLYSLLGVANTLFTILSSNIKSSEFLKIFNLSLSVLKVIYDSTNALMSSVTQLKDETDINNFSKLMSIKKIYYESLFFISMKLKKTNMLKDNIYEEFINNYFDAAITNILYNVYPLISENNNNNNSNQTNNLFFCFTENAALDKAVNIMKAKAFMLISLYVQNEAPEIKNNIVIDRCTKLFTIICIGFKYLINNKYDYISKMGRDNINYPDNEYNSIIFQANLFLSRILVREPILSDMQMHIKEFVEEIVIPLLLTTEKEYLNFKTDGEEHHLFYIDCLGEFQNKSYKTSIAFIMSKIAEKYDGIISYTINLVVSLLEFYKQGGSSNSNNLCKVPLSKDFLNFHKSEILVDLCFFLVNLLYKFIPKNKNFFILKNFIINNIADICNVSENQINNRILFNLFSNDLVKDKIVFFIGLYADHIFLEEIKEIKAVGPENLEFNYNNIKTKEADYVNNQITKSTFVLNSTIQAYLPNIIEYLFRTLVDFKNCEGSSYNASYSIKNVLSIKFIVPIYKLFMSNFFSTFISYFNDIEIVPYFELIHSILVDFNESSKKDNNIDNNNNIFINKDSLTLLVNNCVKRILIELKSNKSTNIDSSDYMSVIMNKCFNILLEISLNYTINIDNNTEIKDFSINSQKTLPNENIPSISGINDYLLNKYISVNEFEILLVNITNYIKNPNKISFDLDIIIIITNIQKKTTKLLESSSLIYNNINKLIDKHQMNIILYNFLYSFIEKGLYIFKDTEELAKLIRIIIISIDENECIELIYSNLLVELIFMQNINIPENIFYELIDSLFNECDEIISFCIEDVGYNFNVFDSFKLVVLLATISSGYIKHNTYMIKYMSEIKNNKLKLVKYREAVDVLTCFKEKPFYQIKILCLGIIRMLSNLNLLESNPIEYSNWLKLLINILDTQKKYHDSKLDNQLEETECFILENELDEDNKQYEYKKEILNDENMYPGYEESEEAMKNFNTLYSKEDEYAYFDTLIAKINEANSDFLNNAIKEINSKNSFEFNDMLKTRRHVFNNTEYIRKIVKIKRNNNA